MYIRIYTYMYTYIYIYTYTYMFKCVWVHIHIHINRPPTCQRSLIDFSLLFQISVLPPAIR